MVVTYFALFPLPGLLVHLRALSVKIGEPDVERSAFCRIYVSSNVANARFARDSHTPKPRKSKRVPWLRPVSTSCPLLGVSEATGPGVENWLNQMSNVQLPAENISRQKTR